jgi:hypothetical protein
VDRRLAAMGTFQRAEATSVPLKGAQRLSGRCILDYVHNEFLFCINCSLKYSEKDLHCIGIYMSLKVHIMIKSLKVWWHAALFLFILSFSYITCWFRMDILYMMQLVAVVVGDYL